MTARTLTRAEENRITAGLIVQPLVAAVVTFLTFPLMFLNSDGTTMFHGSRPESATDAAMALAVATGFVALIVAFFLVWPIATYLIRRRQLTLGDTLLWGLAFGNLTHGVVIVLVRAGGEFDLFLRNILFSSLLGAVGAVAFWYLAIRPLRRATCDRAGTDR